MAPIIWILVIYLVHRCPFICDVQVDANYLLGRRAIGWLEKEGVETNT